jgi:endonuclease-3
MSDPRVQLLVSRGRALLSGPPEPIRFAGPAAAHTLINDLAGHPHAFVLACVFDRQVPTDIAWRGPNEIASRLGGFGFTLLRGLSLDGWRSVMLGPPPLHRFAANMAECAHDAVQRIQERYGGDASRIWSDRPSSAELVFRFLDFRGVGPKIANMAANILVRHFRIELADYYSIDISADVHVRRVFSRLGFTEASPTVERVVYKARALYPEFPGIMDLPVWEIGKNWCRPTEPQCEGCPMSQVCDYRAGAA